MTMLPQGIMPVVHRQLMTVREIHRRDISENYAGATLSESFARKYPAAGKERGWQYLFPASLLCAEPNTGWEFRHYFDENVLERAVKAAVLRSRGVKERTLSLVLPFRCHPPSGTGVRYLRSPGAPRAQ